MENGFTKFIFGDDAEIVDYSNYAYDIMKESSNSGADALENHKGYRFDSTHQQEINNFVKNIHVHIKSNHPKMSDKEFLKISFTFIYFRWSSTL